MTVPSFFISLATGYDGKIEIKNGSIVAENGFSLLAPSGTITLSNVTLYDANGEFTFSAADHSLHFVGNVKLLKDDGEGNTVAANVTVPSTTHIVVESGATLIVKNIVVEQVGDHTLSIELNNTQEEEITVQGEFTATGENDEIISSTTTIKTFAELADAAANGFEMRLGADIAVTGQVVFNGEATLDLNGYTIYNEVDIWHGGDWSLISVQSGTLTVTGNGTMLAKENDCYTMDVRDGANLVIENGTFVGNIHAIYVYEGNLTVNGGKFSVQQPYDAKTPYGFTLNMWDTNRANGKATITVKGGTFYKFDPSNNVAEGPATCFTAEGYASNPDGDYYTVAPITTVTTYAQFAAAAAAGNNVRLGSDIDMEGCIFFENSAMLDLNGYTLYNEQDIWSDTDWSLISVQSGTLTVTGNGTMLAKENDCYTMDVRDGANLVIENGTFVGNIHAIYVYEGNLTVNGGKFSVQQPYDAKTPYGFTLNMWDTNRANGTATITVKGGTFYKFDPSNNVAEGPQTSFMAEGYSSTEEGDYFVVSKD